uniref:Uncharacterized protein n=1 Tax=Lactuca sativa TaxID=4236 RepID=A0A9R1UVP8_LACSA|nr:hypothetical protein LSAT_V11C800389620 [Lactuca sativa]
MWQQWPTAYPGAYSALETIADDPQNITLQVRQLIIMEDPYIGSTDEQDRAYRDLDRITCEETKNLWSFLQDFRRLAIASAKNSNPVYGVVTYFGRIKEIWDINYCMFTILVLMRG